MPLLDLHAVPTATTRRWFGLSLALLLLLLGFFLGGGNGIGAFAVRTILWCLAAAIALVYYLFPAVQLAIIRFWQYATYPIAWTVGHLLLLLTFFAVFLPISVALKCTGYDPLRLRKSGPDSEWISRRKSDSVAEYFRQF